MPFASRDTCAALLLFYLPQFNTGDSYAVTKGMTDFVEGIPGYNEIASGSDLLVWVKEGVVPAMFSDKKCT